MRSEEAGRVVTPAGDLERGATEIETARTRDRFSILGPAQLVDEIAPQRRERRRFSAVRTHHGTAAQFVALVLRFAVRAGEIRGRKRSAELADDVIGEEGARQMMPPST